MSLDCFINFDNKPVLGNQWKLRFDEHFNDMDRVYVPDLFSLRDLVLILNICKFTWILLYLVSTFCIHEIRSTWIPSNSKIIYQPDLIFIYSFHIISKMKPALSVCTLCKNLSFYHSVHLHSRTKPDSWTLLWMELHIFETAFVYAFFSILATYHFSMSSLCD